MPDNFADRLTLAIKEKGTPTCVGIDPQYERLPADITARDGLGDAGDNESAIDAVSEYCRRVIKIVAPLVPAVKINAAFFEQYYWDGFEAYYGLVQEARSRGLIVIGDLKRGDVGHSAAMYARAHLARPAFDNLEEDMIPDAVTVNSYLGIDGVRPFIDVARSEGKGLFVLVRTSNESSTEVQSMELKDGGTVAEHVGRLVNGWAGDAGLVGRCGYSCVGAVAAPHDPASMGRLRAMMPNCIFLVPGFGAQGRGAEDVAHCFKPDGTGAIVTASRSVIYAYEDNKYLEMYASEWEKCVERACQDFTQSVAAIVKG